MQSTPPLRELAARRGFRIGAAMSVPRVDDDPHYGPTLAREFNITTAENHMKFGLIEPARGQFDFALSDRTVAFAEAHAMAVRGHTLVWHHQNPDWLTEGGFDADATAAILRDHIRGVAGHFRGRLTAWDVVNEGIADDAAPRDTLWYRALGLGYIAQAFRWAHEADPDVPLFYNDYGADGINAKSDAVYTLVKDLLADGVPIHGVGFQMHVKSLEAPTAEDFAANLRRFAALGLQVQVTEMDVWVQDQMGVPLAERFARQAEVYRDILRVCLEAPACTALVLWGFTDKYSWVPHFSKADDWALIFDAEYRPKPAYDAMAAELARGL